jgi:hypothetical protein
MRLLVIGGSDAGISAGLRARELDPTVDKSSASCSPTSLAAMRSRSSTTPPFGSPWDAVQMAAQAWTRQAHGGQPTQAASHETPP